jgi:metal-responsive CopG/Arc/MetJ family transcriptional regulator
MPERVLEAADRFAEQTGETRSGLLARAVSDYINQHRDKSSPQVKPVGLRKRRTSAKGK